MDRFNPADYERIARPRGARKTINYYDLNSNGFNEVEEPVEEAKTTSKAKSTKRKQSTGGDGPPSKRTKTKEDLKPASKPTPAPKDKAPAKGAVSKSKTPPTNKAKQAQPPSARAQKAPTTPKAPKAASAKVSKPDGSTQKTKAASGAGRGKKAANITSKNANSYKTQLASNVSVSSAENEEQAARTSESATPRINTREYWQAANTAKPGQISTPRPAPRSHTTLDFRTSTIHRSAPRRQFFSATSFGAAFARSMADMMSDTTSELSDVPDDLDMTSPLEFEVEASSGGAQQNTAQGTVEDPAAPTTPGQDSVQHLPSKSSPLSNIVVGPSSSAMPPATNSPLSNIQVARPSAPPQIAPAPSLPPPPLAQRQTRIRRTTKQVERLGNFVHTTFDVDDNDTGATDDVAGDEDADADAHISSADEDIEEPTPDTTKSKRRGGRQASTAAKEPARAPKAPKAPKAAKTTTTKDRKRKNPAGTTDEPDKPAKRPRAAKPRARRAARGAEGLLTPADSQEDSDGQAASEIDLSTADPEVVKRHELSEKLTARLPIDSKPLPRGQPEVWADSRQALCETLPYFKSYNSGCYSNGGHVYSFLLDGVGSSGGSREYMDPDVVVARAGGSLGMNKFGQYVQKEDHIMADPQVQSVLNNITLQNPLVVIGGNRHEGAVCKLPHRYNVLDWYMPTDVWGEKTLGMGGKVYITIKYRFERLKGEKKAWHAPEERLVSDEDKQVAGPLLRKECGHCHKQCPQVYLLGWMCLNPGCDQFWHHNGRDAPYGALHWNPAFLLDRTPWAVGEEPYGLRLPVPDVGNFIGDNLTEINSHGICCPACGRCSSRRLFKGWKCDNPACTYEKFPRHMPVRVPMLHKAMEITGDGPTLSRNKHADGVNMEVSYHERFKAYKYTVPGVNGSFTHLVSNGKINREPGGPDDMFQAIQDQDNPEMDLHLERRRFRGAKMSGNKAEEKKAMKNSKRQSSSKQNETLDSIDQTTTVDDTTMMEPNQLDESLLQAAETDEPTADQTIDIVKDGDMMKAYSMNYGMPYKFVASGASKPFTDSPWPVRAVRADLNWASQTFLPAADHVEFNEELIFAYLEYQKLEYHDDGEEGLGPRIATMSLGGKANMYLRMKQKHYMGYSKTGILTPEKPIPGGFKHNELYEKRLAAHEELEKIKHTDKKLYEQRRRELPEELGLTASRHKQAPDLLTITLSHGDIVLMEGYDIQQYLEHKVESLGCLRFALTCRVVQEDHLKESEKPDYEVGPDEEGMSALRRMAEREAKAKEGDAAKMGEV
ncbi:hypothetical protein PRZ48_005566 [Zasmidium cellare]|uniref:Alpha-ketoglutarate-dependent dioxygenase AlkB-like domain-containing protein n=1 Tax=Zasmidium cellare TaxID=395010 RepID=A0ABR0ELR1_ZASCE|nr:hypothetical protein PRZ48_005566 [Zasmidium cellare]